MATFRKLPSGKWEAAVSVKGQRKSKSFTAKGRARAWAATMETQMGRGDGIAGNQTAADLFRQYADEVSSKKKGARWEIIRLKRFEAYPIAKRKLQAIRREDVEMWMADRLTADIKASSVNRELNLMSHCFTLARRWRWMNHNPMQDLQRPKNPPARDRRITQDEIDAILVALGYDERIDVETQQQKVAVAFLFAIETAMRAGEICSLDSINEDDRTAFLAETKNGHARYVPLSKEAVRLWKRLPGKGFGLASGTLSAVFRKAVVRAGIEGLTFHDTRHEGITRLAKKIDVLDLARAVGHKDIRQLQSYYNATAADIAKQLD